MRDQRNNRFGYKRNFNSNRVPYNNYRTNPDTPYPRNNVQEDSEEHRPYYNNNFNYRSQNNYQRYSNNQIDQRSKRITRENDNYNPPVYSRPYQPNQRMLPRGAENRAYKIHRAAPSARIINPERGSSEQNKRKGLLPQANPTANPFNPLIKLPTNVEDLRKLQVKVVLNKIGEAPRWYAVRLREAEHQE
jgi:hypothetical protein